MDLSIRLSGESLTEVLTADQLEQVKSKVGGSLFKDGEKHDLLKQVGNFGGLSKSATSGFYSVSFQSGTQLITRYVSRGNMVAQVEAAGLVTKPTPKSKDVQIDWGKLNWKVEDGELLLIS